MALADDIRLLRDQAAAELAAAHDYFIDTKIAWRMVEDAVAAGQKFRIRNKVTGTVTTHDELVRKASGYVTKQLTEATFTQFISIFENFFLDLLRLWLTAYPQSLMNKQLEFRTVLEAPDKDAITLAVVNKEIGVLLYDRPAEWFGYLERRVKLGCPTPDEIDRIAEAKASRDVLVHNRGVVNKIYESKAGKLARYKPGQRIDIPENYHRQTWELIGKVMADIANSAIAKVA